MPTAPGHTTTIGDRAAAPIAAASTAAAFFVGVAQKGPTTPTLVVSLTDFVEKFGERMSGSPLLYDAVDAAFHEGASVIYVARSFTAETKTAEKQAVDAESKKVFKVFARSRGAWGNNVKVVVTLSSGSIVLQVYLSGTLVETSPSLGTTAEAVVWAKENSDLITLEDNHEVEGADAKTQTLELSGGADDATNAAKATAVTEALARFTRDLGPGQVAAPGNDDDEVHAALLTHAAANNRRAILDEVVEASEGTLVGTATSLRGATARYGMLCASWVVCPGVSLGTTRKIPFSAVMVGLISRATAAGFPYKAAAAKRGRAKWALELVTTFTDVQRAALDAAGVTGSIMKRGVVTNYGDVTLVNQTSEPNWEQFSASRTVMACAALADEVMDNYDFEDIDGHGYVFNDLKGDLVGSACMPLYAANALYGQTPEEAFAVNTGPDVNTPASITAKEIKAQIAIDVSPTARNLVTEIVKVPVLEGVG